MTNHFSFECKRSKYDKARELIEEFGGSVSTVFTWKNSYTISATFPCKEQLDLFVLSLKLEDEILW